MLRIPVPKTPKAAFNPERRAGTLLKAQLTHLEWAVRPAAERRPGRFDVPTDLTEAQVAARIERLMADLHQKTASREPVIKPKAGARPGPSPKRAKRPRERTHRRKAR
jgi:hypothetical protein